MPPQGELDYRDPDEMTPEERLNEILDILARASVRLAERERGLSKDEIAATAPVVYTPYQHKGRIPFGQRKQGAGRSIDKGAESCISRVRELAAAGHSIRDIADQLNREDKRTRYAGRWSRGIVWGILGRAKQETP